MREPLELVMPMGGASSRFLRNGFECPKPLIELHGKPFFYWATESLYHRVPVRGLTFVILRDHAERFGLAEQIMRYYPEARLVMLDQVLPGAVLTCLKGVEGIEDTAPVLFNDCDHYFRSTAFEAFCRDGRQVDGALLTFASQEPCYSYVAFDENGHIAYTVEKKVVSQDAICGAYYFGSKQIFCRYAEQYLDQCNYAEFFLSGVYNNMARDGRISIALPVDVHIPFGTPDEYYAAQQNWPVSL